MSEVAYRRIAALFIPLPCHGRESKEMGERYEEEADK
jgi:hypothetical protein